MGSFRGLPITTNGIDSVSYCYCVPSWLLSLLSRERHERYRCVRSHEPHARARSLSFFFGWPSSRHVGVVRWSSVHAPGTLLVRSTTRLFPLVVDASQPMGSEPHVVSATQTSQSKKGARQHREPARKGACWSLVSNLTHQPLFLAFAPPYLACAKHFVVLLVRLPVPPPLAASQKKVVLSRRQRCRERKSASEPTNKRQATLRVCRVIGS